MSERDRSSAPAPVRVAVLIPSMDQWMADFCLALTGLLRHAERVPSPDGAPIEASVHNVRTSVIARSRAMLAEHAQKTGADWALWLDSDMIFPPDTLHRLFAHGKDLVAANYPMREVPRDGKVGGTAVARDGQSRLPFEGNGLVAAGSAGLGLCLMRVNLLKTIGQPWFGYDPIVHGMQSYAGEDTFFFLRLHAGGHELLIDMDLSRQIGHVAQAPVYAGGLLALPRNTVYSAA